MVKKVFSKIIYSQRIQINLRFQPILHNGTDIKGVLCSGMVIDYETFLIEV